jgi:hypothetical protein
VRLVTTPIVCLVTTIAASTLRLDAQATPPAHGRWRAFAAGFASSILLHEAGHVVASFSLGGRPTFGFDTGRPTVYSGIDAKDDPHKQFIFSGAGLTVQTLLDEIILDVPHSNPAAPASAFERGVLAGGLGTTLFYLTIGRRGSVSDVDFMARTGALSATQVTVIYGSVAALHALRISRSGRYANFFMRPSSDGRLLIGVSSH